MTPLKPINRKKTRIDDLPASSGPVVLDDAALRLVTGGLAKNMSTCTGSTLNGADEGVDYD